MLGVVGADVRVFRRLVLGEDWRKNRERENGSGNESGTARHASAFYPWDD